ncbi:TPA: hypothetical protein EYP44_02505 [Candidatus Bathyarchaeota archaeon]|nr:hypothetical protein [Candidatus Bathyarchaeota archaeon]
MTTHIERIVVDALKPRELSIVELSKALCDVKGVREVNIIVAEVDVRTETIKITLRGDDINYDGMVEMMDEFGAVVRSIDEISTRKR